MFTNQEAGGGIRTESKYLLRSKFELVGRIKLSLKRRANLCFSSTNLISLKIWKLARRFEQFRLKQIF